jgi:hypothetical protein
LSPFLCCNKAVPFREAAFAKQLSWMSSQICTSAQGRQLHAV